MRRAIVEELVQTLRKAETDGPYSSEADFERRFVERLCKEVLRGTKLYVHPWGDKALASDWKVSKDWAAVHAWGTVQAFDLIGRDESGPEPHKNSLAVEVKLSKATTPGLPTGDFQRMLGQCLLARLIHPAVVGVFGYCGDLRVRKRDDGKAYLKKLADETNIWVVLKKIG